MQDIRSDNDSVRRSFGVLPPLSARNKFKVCKITNHHKSNEN